MIYFYVLIKYFCLVIIVIIVVISTIIIVIIITSSKCGLRPPFSALLFAGDLNDNSGTPTP